MMHEKHSPSPEEIHTYWFGTSLPAKKAIEEQNKLWFLSNEKVDCEIEEKFGHLINHVANRELDQWKETAKGRLSLIIILDQFPRHLYRGKKEAFQYDEIARQLALEGISLGQDQSLDPFERLFFYMPLQHAEDLQLQNLSVALFRQLGKEMPPSLEEEGRSYIDYAERHQKVIARFGRFPHRNQALNRQSTEEELSFLEGGRSF